jgi:hypothetical protein
MSLDELKARAERDGVDSLSLEERLRVIAGMTAEQRRQRAIELGYKPDYDWADWVLAESKAEKRKRQHRIRRGLLTDRARRRAMRRGIMSRGRIVVPRARPRGALAPRSRSTIRRRARSPGRSRRRRPSP